MTKYHSFTHVEKLDKPECEGLLDGYVYITSKLDGTNALVWYDEETGLFKTGSRKRELGYGKSDNAGFDTWFQNIKIDNSEPTLLRKALLNNPDWIIYGEWLGTDKCIGHIKDYNSDAIGKFWIFDVYDARIDVYVPDVVWRAELTKEDYDLSDYIVPIIAEGEGFTIEKIQEIAKGNKFLLDNANHAGEGVVVRNPDFRNKYGRYTIGKLVLDEYIQEQKTKKKPQATPGEVEKSIIDIYVTDTFLSKNIAKVCIACDAEEFDVKNGKMIGMMIQLTWKDLLEENITTIVKKMKNPTINFAALNNLCTQRVKEYIGL